jgi:hypothetical protein
MGSPSRREPHGDGVAVVAAGVTTCQGAEESSVQDEGRQGNSSNLMRRREMRRGQRGRSGNWRAGCLETSTSGSEEGGWKRAARVVPRQPPILLRLSARKMVGALFLEHLIAHNGSHVASSVHHYFKLPGGDKSKCTHWEKSVKLC